MSAFVPRQVPWGHHPAEVKAALREAGVRPVQKACHLNSQRLFLADGALRDRLAYVEGTCTGKDLPIPFRHAWLELDGNLLDLTLDASKHEYRPEARPSRLQVAQKLTAGVADFVSSGAA